MREAQAGEAEAKRRLHGEGPTSEETAAIIGKLEYDLHTCRGECDELRANLHTAGLYTLNSVSPQLESYKM
jgi:hypothetical protein